jgi:hypothetical protein
MQLCIIHYTINDGCLSPDPILSAVSMNMKFKYEKHWEDMDNINFFIYVAFILDPRSKMMALEFWLEKCNGHTWARKIKEMVTDILKRLMDQYNKFHMGSSFVDVNTNRSNDAYVDAPHGNLEDNETQFRSMFTKHIKKVNDLQYRSELDRYLHDGPVPETNDFDILACWKIHAPTYPIFAEIARDVLAIHISSVASESAFSTSGRVLDSFRSSLSPITVEALICTQDWLLDRLSIDEFDDLLESCDDLGNVFKLIICKFIYFSLLINLFNFSYCRWASSFKFNDGIIF